MRIIQKLKFTTLSLSFLSLSFLLPSLCLITSCASDDDVNLLGNWVNKFDFDGKPRRNGVAFVIGNKAYFGTGYNYEDDVYLRDFWEYDAENNTWKAIKPLPGVGRTSAVAFSLDGKGYVGTGYDGTNRLKDFYEYDPEADGGNGEWTAIADFAGTARRGAVAFGIGEYGYVGTGNDADNNLKDFWQYDPQANGGNGEWTQTTSVGGSKRMDAFAFTIGNTVYLGGGYNDAYIADFWAFNPSNQQWSKKQDMDEDYSTLRRKAVAFAIHGKGYIATGLNSNALADCWEYNPDTDEWSEKTNFEGSGRTEATGFAINNIGYVLTGRSSNEDFDDFWAFYPTDEKDEDD
jgi:N-acetylneuraminic acid mutarotase